MANDELKETIIQEGDCDITLKISILYPMFHR